jgi:hypothetical protein
MFCTYPKVCMTYIYIYITPTSTSHHQVVKQFKVRWLHRFEEKDGSGESTKKQ